MLLAIMLELSIVIAAFQSGTVQFMPYIHSWKHTERIIAQQQAVIFDGKATRIGRHCIVASRLDGNGLTDSSQVHYVHCLLGNAIKTMYVIM